MIHDDPFLWLEEVDSPKALAWVREQNARSLALLESDPRYPALLAEARAVIAAPDRIPYPHFLGDRLANFWQDEAHIRGLWRQTTLASFRTPNPQWQTILDVDAPPRWRAAIGYQAPSRCRPTTAARWWCCRMAARRLELREFDLAAARFVENGFYLPEAKQSASWIDDGTLLVARDWGPGTLTNSGYPFIVKQLPRGIPLDAAKEVFRGTPGDVNVRPAVLRDPDGVVQAILVFRALTFFESETYLLGDEAPCRLPVPLKSQFRDFVALERHFLPDAPFKI